MTDVVAARQDGPVVRRVRAPSTLEMFLHAFTFSHVGRLDVVAPLLLINPSAHAPLYPAAGDPAYVDVDDTLQATCGYAKQGAVGATPASKV